MYKTILVDMVTGESGTKDAGENILAKAKNLDSYLIVMGAYGHFKIHEMVIGSVTKYVTANMTIPVLLSH